MKLSEDIRNSRLDVIQTAIGPSPTIEILTSEGQLICTGKLPVGWLTRSVNGQVSKTGVWEIPESQGEGVAGRYRIYSGNSEISGDLVTMKLSLKDIKRGQTVVVDEFTLSEGNG